METRNRLSRWAALTATAFIMLAGLTASCSKSDDDLVPDVEVGETVKDFKKVKQEADTNVKINGISIACVCDATYTQEDGSSGTVSFMTFSFATIDYKNKQITTKLKDNVLHVEGVGNNGDDDIREFSISFDIENYSEMANKKANVKNLKVYTKRIRNGYDYLRTTTLEIEATDINGMTSYTPKEITNAMWARKTTSGGVKISKMTELNKEVKDDGRTSYTEYNIKENPINEMNVSIGFIK